MTLGRLAYLGVALAGLSCQSQTTDGGTEEDLPTRAESSCLWQSRCLSEFRTEYGSVERCTALEIYRHAIPSACAEANADFKDCLSELTCPEFVAVRPTIDALQTQSDAGIPPTSLPCEIKLMFYLDACAEWTCTSGQIVNRQTVCDGQQDCADGSDENGCP
jgi:hypothetical protein